VADVQPFPALHYDLARVGSLADVTAPPYDVIDAEQRAELLVRSPLNVVEIDLPQAGPGENPYRHAASTLADWELEGILRRDAEPALWALTQEYEAPDGARLTRHAILARVRVEDYGPGRVRPHERTQPGPKRDRLALTQATRYNLSPIFSLTSSDAWPRIEPVTRTDPWGEVTDDDGTLHRVWRVSDPAVHEAVAAELAGAELLIADGHHRYETARRYMREVGGEGPHCYTLMALTALDDPGLTVFPTHRLLGGLAADLDRREHLREGLRELFEVEEVDDDRLDPGGEDGLGVFGYVEAQYRQPLRLRLKDTAELDRMLADRPQAYRELDVVILETLVLTGVLGLSGGDIAAKRGIGYATSLDEVMAGLDRTYDAAFVLRPTPIEQVREVAAAGETMPPKSTYFFPKILSGIVFNPLT
jgi:uncharacterized protein (DUF1015 family)